MPIVIADWGNISYGRFAGEAHTAQPGAFGPTDGKIRMTPTVVFETYWRFAAERLAMFYRRYTDPSGPWTSDSILKAYRFTNAYRAADRVSQYLIREVQARPDRPQTAREIFFRTMLFKIFNRIDTWETLEVRLGPIEWRNIDLEKVDRTLEDLRSRGQTLAVVAVVLTAAAVAFLGWRFAGLPIAAAIALGAIVSPPDPVAANESLARSANPAANRALSFRRRGPAQRRDCAVHLPRCRCYSCWIN